MSFLIGITGVIYGLYYAFVNEHAGFTGYLNKPSMVLIGLVPPCIMLLSHKITDFYTGIKILAKSSFQNADSKQKEIINALTFCSAKVRAEGVGALVSVRTKLRYDLLLDGVSLIVNNFSPDEIRHNLTAKIEARQSQMSLASNLFENMSKVCPGVGMMGTLMGQISMMSKLSDPSAIGSGMALALLATLYGLLLGTIVYAPFGEKILIEAEKIYEMDMLVLEGVLALKGKKSSVHLKDIMKTYAKKESSKGRK